MLLSSVGVAVVCCRLYGALALKKQQVKICAVFVNTFRYFRVLLLRAALRCSFKKNQGKQKVKIFNLTRDSSKLGIFTFFSALKCRSSRERRSAYQLCMELHL